VYQTYFTPNTNKSQSYMSYDYCTITVWLPQEVQLMFELRSSLI